MRQERSKWQFREQLISRARTSMSAAAAHTLIHFEKSRSDLELNHTQTHRNTVKQSKTQWIRVRGGGVRKTISPFSHPPTLRYTPGAWFV
jgi:hypothetical protein